ncbi:MAG: sulfite exporter TauE/SafE family protein [Candidatus Hydrogenedens sp.]|nr:sulfite exporter TauE/SafE family protein [Candidatus Hydrogenedentota bacterium]NLF57186.1 sulfite exporter TauE/SafE family protein [Candidatus Hydrogenedens sp.]
MFNEFMLPGVPAGVFWSFVLVGVIIQGISKSGFAGGAGILSLPLMMLVMPVTRVPAVLLPLLILFDMNAIYHHRHNKDMRLVWTIFFPSLVGTALATWVWHAVGKSGVEGFGGYIKQFTGVIAVLFALYIFAKETSMRWVQGRRAGFKTGVAAGVAAGFTSTINHSAGPIVSLYMFSQDLGKSFFTGTVAWTFAFINLSKLPSYAGLGLIDYSVLKFDLLLLPLIPLGSWLGKWMHHNVSERAFNWVILVLTLIAGVQLILNVNLIQMGLEALLRG